MSYQIKFTDLARFPADVVNVSDNRFNGPVSPSNPAYYTSATGTANNAQTTLTLAGRGVVDYGLPIQQSLVYMLEHFANYRSPVVPQPGQIWYKTRPPSTDPAHAEAIPVGDPPNIGLYLRRGSITRDGAQPNAWAAIPVSGQMFQSFDMSNGSGGFNRITNLADATANRDAMSRQAGDARYIQTGANDTKNGTLTLSGAESQIVLPNNPMTADHATRRGYVDTAISNAVSNFGGALSSQYLPITGGSLTGTLNLPFDNLNLAIGDINLTSGSINLPSGGSINIGVGNLTVTNGVFTAGGPANFANLATFSSGALFESTLVTVNDTQIDLTGASSITGLPLPTFPGDAVNKQYVDNIALALGADGVVSGGSINLSTGAITLDRTVGGPITLLGNVATIGHNHQATDVMFNANPPTIRSHVRDELIGEPIWPASVTLDAALRLIDSAVSRLSAPLNRQLIVSDGITATIEIDYPIRVEYNDMQVYVDGVKWIASKHAEALFDISPHPPQSSSSGLSSSTTYSFNLTIDGVLYPDVSITTPVGVTSYYALSQLIDAELVDLGIPAVCAVIRDFIRIASASAGAGSSVIIAQPTTGTSLLDALPPSTDFTNSTITTSYAYVEDGLPYQTSEQFTFTTIPPAGSVVEIISR